MAIISADQITIVDVTDAYSVILTSEAYTFVGGTDGVAAGASCNTQAVAFCGTTQCTMVSIDQSSIICPSGISAAVTNNNTKNPTITFTTTSTIADACEATIPVIVDGITVNNVAPGVIYTDRNVEALSDPEYAKNVVNSIPVGFYGEPKDCAGIVSLLCSDDGRYITGQSIYVDGGKSVQ